MSAHYLGEPQSGHRDISFFFIIINKEVLAGDSNGTVSLAELKEGKFKSTYSDKTIYDYAYYICRGGWPLAINKDREIALAQARDYYEVVVSDDIFSLKEIPLRRDEQRARKLMRSYARNVSIPAADETLREDCTSGDEKFDKDVFAKYLKKLSVDIKKIENEIDGIFMALAGHGGYIDYYNASDFECGSLDDEKYEEAFDLSVYAYVKTGNCDIDEYL